MKNLILENWFKIGILTLMIFALLRYSSYLDESNLLLSRIKYSECKGQLETLDQKGLDNGMQLNLAVYQTWDSACNGILTYK